MACDIYNGLQCLVHILGGGTSLLFITGNILVAFETFHYNGRFHNL
jgi:hypothetical protein